MLLTVPEAAALLRIGRTKAYEMARSGELPVVRIGRCVRVLREALQSQISGSVPGANRGRSQ